MTIDKVPLGWKLTTLDGIAQKGGRGLVDGPFGSNLPASSYVPSGIPVIRGSNLSLGEMRFRDDDFVFVSEEMARRLERSLCGPDDIVFTKKGTLGQIGLVPRSHKYSKFLLSSNQMKLSVDRELAEPVYTFYYLASPISRDKIIQDSEATGVPKTNLAYLRNFPILLPPLFEQRAIAHILGTLDDKIELNRRMNETLEAMARAIFKSWFVDFDPVRTKSEGRQPFGMNAETSALFPNSFQDSPLGKIPKGWKCLKLEEVIELAYGNALKAEKRHEGNIPVYGSNGQIGWHNEALVQGPGIVVGRKGNPGVVTWVDSSFFPIDTTFYVVPKATPSSVRYLYHCLSRLDLPSQGADSAVPGLNRNIAYMSDVLVPFPATVRAFDSWCTPLMARVHSNKEESRTLSSIRDALLPKLISGKIRVKDAEKFLEKAL